MVVMEALMRMEAQMAMAEVHMAMVLVTATAVTVIQVVMAHRTREGVTEDMVATVARVAIMVKMKDMDDQQLLAGAVMDVIDRMSFHSFVMTFNNLALY